MKTHYEGIDKKKVLLWSSGLILGAMIIGLVATLALFFNSEKIHPQVYIEGVEVGGLTREEALHKLQRFYDKKINQSQLQFYHHTLEWQRSYHELGYTYLYQEAVKEAYEVGRTGSMVERLKNMIKRRKTAQVIGLRGKYQKDKVDALIVEMGYEVDKEPVNAKIQRQQNSFVITKEEVGVKIDDALLRNRIEEALENNHRGRIPVPIKRVLASVTEQDLKSIEVMIGEFTTNFNPQQEGRTKNIEIGSTSIDGTLLMPGEVFSFNEKTGPRSVEEGYQEAPVILGGRLVPGVGGGICQVSTTLYNAVVRSDLEIVTRQNHSLPVSYVPLGHDATVAYDYLDFQFKNSTTNPIYIESTVLGNRLEVRIYGETAPVYQVRLVSEIIERISPTREVKWDSNLLVGQRQVQQEGKQGYRVRTDKVYYEGDREIRREQISTDYYPPVKSIIAEGTKPRLQRSENNQEVSEEPLEFQETEEASEGGERTEE